MTPSVTYLTIKSDAYGNVSIGTTLNQAAIHHRQLTPGEKYTQVLLKIAELLGAPLHHGRQHVPALALAADVIHPEGWGHGVPEDLWRSAKRVLDESREVVTPLQEVAT